ncbi:MAG: hypothetical protein JOY76_08715 [Hyphomicrobiales bacterium]|nr:hypothetical protein [Hyphomicrobiales bacterium]
MPAVGSALSQLKKVAHDIDPLEADRLEHEIQQAGRQLFFSYYYCLDML